MLVWFLSHLSQLLVVGLQIPKCGFYFKKLRCTMCEGAGFGDSCQLQKTGFTSHFTENHLVRKIYHHLRGENPFFYFCVEWELCFRHANSCRIGYYRPSCIINAERHYFLLSSDSLNGKLPNCLNNASD